MSRILQLPAIGKEGRFGNWLIHYLVGRSLADQFDATLQTPSWVGEELFEISDSRLTAPAPLLSPLLDVGYPWEGARALPPFFDLPHRIVDPCLTRRNVQRVFRWKPRYQEAIEAPRVAVHVRQGDFQESGFPVVPKDAIKRRVQEAGFDDVAWIEESKPHPPLKPDDPPWLADFLLLSLAQHVFVYPRSTFSQMAALLGNGVIYMPWNYEPDPTAVRYHAINALKPAVFQTRNNKL